MCRKSGEKNKKNYKKWKYKEKNEITPIGGKKEFNPSKKNIKKKKNKEKQKTDDIHWRR